MEHQVSHRLPRVLIFPLPAQGPVNSMLKLAELLALQGLHVTFLNTQFTHNHLLLHADIQARFATYPGFLFKTISDGLPDDHPRSGDTVMEVIRSINTESKSVFRHMLVSDELGSENSPSVTCIIVDGIFGGFATDIANELHIPIIHFRTLGACCIWVNLCIPKVIEGGELPIRDVATSDDAYNLEMKLPDSPVENKLARGRWKQQSMAGTVELRQWGEVADLTQALDGGSNMARMVELQQWEI
ncbi:hypothetical protein FEM48_Zijuj03G0074700 [Ziziphus jujuba var. spinosa]|uniref:7-deoxyloganetic acid glucosyltransferase-like n=1 Tax=Ziziphus jujuba var. spinosa TaxID=714518 RepID=A0A978VNZ2_ZIZJJ|nr:hypothetical protein FEM48_Zijuj03G0074700 [Ziziphus jujuba var. spinosa]